MEVLAPSLSAPDPTTLQRAGEDAVTSTSILRVVTLTQAAYDALATKVATTLYVIVG